MWIRTVDSDEVPSLVNMDKVHQVDIYGGRSHSHVRAYLDDGGHRDPDDCTDYSSLDLFEGTYAECVAYFKWLVKELDVTYGVSQYLGRRVCE